MVKHGVQVHGLRTMLRLRSAAIIAFTTLCALGGITAGSPALTSQPWTDTRLHGMPVLPLVQGTRGGAGQDGVPNEV